MSEGTRVEFWKDGALMAAVDNVGGVPSENNLINIRKKTYRITSVTWCVDYADGPYPTQLRANVDMDAVEESE